MRTIQTTVYQFDELTDKAKEKARDWYRSGALHYDWWDSIYEDAERIGLKITGFDLDRSRHAEGTLTVSPSECCARIIAQHGKSCGTYSLAQSWFRQKHETPLNPKWDGEEFTKLLLEEYSVMLQHEYEYLMSDESVDESIRANEYEFTEDGKRS